MRIRPKDATRARRDGEAGTPPCNKRLTLQNDRHRVGQTWRPTLDPLRRSRSLRGRRLSGHQSRHSYTGCAWRTGISHRHTWRFRPRRQSGRAGQRSPSRPSPAFQSAKSPSGHGPSISRRGRKKPSDDARPFKDIARTKTQEADQIKDKLSELKKAKPRNDDAIKESETQVACFCAYSAALRAHIKPAEFRLESANRA